MIVPSTWMATRSVRTAGVPALGALGALAFNGGLLMTTVDAAVGPAIVVGGMGLACICWGLNGSRQPGSAVTTRPAGRQALPVRRGRLTRLASRPGGVGGRRAAGGFTTGRSSVP